MVLEPGKSSISVPASEGLLARACHGGGYHIVKNTRTFALIANPLSQ